MHMHKKHKVCMSTHKMHRQRCNEARITNALWCQSLMLSHIKFFLVVFCLVLSYLVTSCHSTQGLKIMRLQGSTCVKKNLEGYLYLKVTSILSTKYLWIYLSFKKSLDFQKVPYRKKSLKIFFCGEYKER